MIKMSTEAILADCQNLTRQQKQNYVNQSAEFWIPNTAYPTKDTWAAEWNFDSFNDLIESNQIDKIFESVLISDLNLDDDLTVDQIKSWLN